MINKDGEPFRPRIFPWSKFEKKMLLHRIKQKLCIYHKSSLIPIECDYNVCKCCPVVIASGITDMITLLTAF